MGAGGLGSPALLYLAAAGVGRIGIVDDDVVDRSNLQRQVVHRERDVGVPKVDSAARAITDLNPDVRVDAHRVRFSARNARSLVSGYDVVLDGTDNFGTRYLINDAAFLEGVPFVHASVFRFEGQVTLFPGTSGPCYRCLFPNPPPPGSVPSCAEAGVLGVLPGVVGTLQATEAVKLVAGIGRSLSGRLLSYDALAMTLRELRYAADPACPLCGDAPVITEPVDSEAACEVGGIERLSAAQYGALCARGDEHLLLDVREPGEVAAGSIDGYLNVPLNELESRIDEIHGWRERLVVCMCQVGERSLRAARLLRSAGFTTPANLEGGLVAWRAHHRASERP